MNSTSRGQGHTHGRSCSIVTSASMLKDFRGFTITCHPQMDLRDSLPASSSGAIPMFSLGYQSHNWPKLKLILNFSNILVCCCCSGWLGLPEPPSMRSRPKEHSLSFRALPANKTSPPRVSDVSLLDLNIFSRFLALFTKFEPFSTITRTAEAPIDWTEAGT